MDRMNNTEKKKLKKNWCHKKRLFYTHLLINHLASYEVFSQNFQFFQEKIRNFYANFFNYTSKFLENLKVYFQHFIIYSYLTIR